MTNYRINITVRVYNEDRKYNDPKRYSEKEIEVTIPKEIALAIELGSVCASSIYSAITQIQTWDAIGDDGEDGQS
jgi:hypothetical protein